MLVAAQVLERLAAEAAGYLLNEAALIVASYALPILGVGALLLSDRLFAHYRPHRTSAPSEVGGAAAQRYFVAPCVMAGVGLVACGAMSTVGIWGNARGGQYAGETWSMLAAAAECLLVVLLCHVTFLSKKRKPLALRYQSSLLVLITAFALTSSRQMLYALPAEVVDGLLVTVENYAHILFWVVALDAAGSLGWPIYRAFSVGLLSCSVTGLVWSVFLEHRMAAAESAVFIVLQEAGHPHPVRAARHCLRHREGVGAGGNGQQRPAGGTKPALCKGARAGLAPNASCVNRRDFLRHRTRVL